MSSAYTPSVEAEMRQVGTFTRESAEKFADKLGVSLRSVTAKIGRMPDVAYSKPEVQAKAPARRKTEIVSSIESLLSVDDDFFSGLDRSTTGSLERIEQRIADVLSQWHDSYMDGVDAALGGEAPEYYSLCVNSADDESESDDANEVSEANG